MKNVTMRKYIGIKTKQHILGWEQECASDRIRARMIVEQFDCMELWNDKTEYDSIIFHHIDMEGIKHEGCKILDVCDLDLIKADNFDEFAKHMDKIVVATDALGDEIKYSTVTIGDGHDVTNRTKKYHMRNAEKVVWFGYAGNIDCLRPYLKTIKECGLKLRIISERECIDCDEFIEWNLETADKHINECDFAVLPFNTKYKTDNKTVTAWLNGLPVAKTDEDIRKLVDPFERVRYLAEVDFREYKIINKAKEYFNICAEYWATKQEEITQKLDSEGKTT